MSVSIASAQDGTAPGDIYLKGMQQYSQGELTAAKETLQKVDAVKLPRDQRVTLYQTIQDIERKLKSPAAADDLLKQAQAAEKAGQPAKAASLYQSVLKDTAASEAQKQTATARLGEVNKSLSGQAEQARQKIDQAAGLVQAGDLDKAEQLLNEVKSSGADLGWFDNERVNMQLKAIAEKRAGKTAATAAPAAPAPAAQGAAVPAPDSNDVMVKARVLFAQEKLAAGRKAEQEGQSRVARGLYEEGLQADPSNAELRAALNAVSAQVDQTSGSQEILPEQLRIIRLRAEAAVAEYKDQMGRANQLMSAGNYAGATEASQQAKVILDKNQSFLPKDQYDALRMDAVNLSARIATEQVAQQDRARKEIEAQRKVESEQRRVEVLQRQNEEIQNLLSRAAELRRAQQYDRALEYINQALYLDPTNVPAQAMKEMIEDSALYVQFQQKIRERNLEMAQQKVDNLVATIPYSQIVNYPSDWPQLSARRLAGLQQDAGESEVNRRVALKLKEAVPVNFEANRLVNVIDYLRNTTGQNFFVNWAALNAVNVQQDQPVTLQLNNVPAEQALRLVLQQVSPPDDTAPLGFSIIEGIVHISTQKDLTRSTDTRVYDIRDLLINIPNFTNAIDFDLSSALSGSGGGGGGGSSIFGGPGGGPAGGEQPLTRAEMITQITTLIQDTIGKSDEWVDRGGDVSSLRELNGNLIIKSTPQNHRQLLALLAQLRETRALQIAVEGRFLLVDQNFLNEVGVDLDIQYDGLGSKFGPVKLSQDSFGLTQRPASSVPGSFSSSTPVDFSTLPYVDGSGYGTTNKSIDFGFSYLDDLQVNLMLRATQANRRSISLSAPRITFFNGQTSFILVARQIAFVSDLQPVADSSGSDPTLSYVQDGVMLQVNGTVSADRRYVTMTVQPSLATVKDPMKRVAVGIGSSGNNNLAPIVGQGFIEAPEVQITQIKTTVSVPDRGTILLGGQRLVSDIEVEAGVPILSKIPVINRLTTNKTTTKDERTLLILIKPTIIIQGEVEDDLFPGLNQDAGRFPGARSSAGRPGGTP